MLTLGVRRIFEIPLTKINSNMRNYPYSIARTINNNSHSLMLMSEEVQQSPPTITNTQSKYHTKGKNKVRIHPQMIYKL